MSRADLTCNETMPPPSDEKLDVRPGYRPGAGLYGGPSTSTARPGFPLPKPPAQRALYPGSLIPSMSGLPHGLSLPGAGSSSSSSNSLPKLGQNQPILSGSSINPALVAAKEAELRREALKKKENDEAIKRSYEEVMRATQSRLDAAGPSTSTAHPGIIRPTPQMPSQYSHLLHHPQPLHPLGASSMSRPMSTQPGFLGHDYLGTTSQVKQIPKGGGVVHAPYNPTMKNRLEQNQREAGSSHSIARPIARHPNDAPTSAAQVKWRKMEYALSQAAQASQEAAQHSRALQEKREAEARARQELERIRQESIERQKQDEERQMRAEMAGVAPIVRPVQRGVANQPMLDPTRHNRGLPAPMPNRFVSNHNNIGMANAMTNALAAAHAQAQAQKEREEREKFERERDRMERSVEGPMILPPMPHQSPMHIPSILQGRNNWNKFGTNSPLRPGYSPGLGNSSGQGTSSGLTSFDSLLGLNSMSYARLPSNLFGATPYTGLGQHVSPSPSTPQVMATPSPRPSILRRKGTDASAGRRTNYKAKAAAAAPPKAPPPAPTPKPIVPDLHSYDSPRGIFDYDSDDSPTRPASINLNYQPELEIKKEEEEEDVKPVIIHRPIAIRPSFCPATGQPLWPTLTLSDSPPPPQPAPIQIMQSKYSLHPTLKDAIMPTATKKTPPRVPSILSRPTAKRRLGFDEANPQTVGELATAQLNSGVIGLTDAKKLKLDGEIKKEPLDQPSTSSFGSSTIKPETSTTASAEPTPKKRQRKQQFDANQAPEQIRMQITEAPYVPIMGMRSHDYPGGFMYYQLPPEAPKKKRGRPSSHAKEQAMMEVRQAQTITRSIIVDVDEPRIVPPKKRGGRKPKQSQPTGLSLPIVPPKTTIKEEVMEPIFTPPPPTRPSSTGRPKSALLQHHHAQLQLQLQQHDQLMKEREEQLKQQQQHEERLAPKTPQKVKTPPEMSALAYANRATENYPLEFDSDEELVCPEALVAAKEVAAQLGLIGPDGKPRETTPVRLARERKEEEDEEEKHREMIQRINSAGFMQLQAAIRKKEEQELAEKEEAERLEKEALEQKKKELQLVDRRLRFLSHDKSIIHKFFRRAKKERRKEEMSHHSDSPFDPEEVFVRVDEEEEKKDGETPTIEDQEKDIEKKKEEPVKKGKSAETKAVRKKSDPFANLGEIKAVPKKLCYKLQCPDSVQKNVFQVNGYEVMRMMKKGQKFEIMNEEEIKEFWKKQEEWSREEEEKKRRAIKQKNLAMMMNQSMKLESLYEKRREMEKRHEWDDELDWEIEWLEKELEEHEASAVEDVAMEKTQEESSGDKEEKRVPLIPLDALGDREDFLRADRQVVVFPPDHLTNPRFMTEEEMTKGGKKIDVKKALGFMRLWKREHHSTEDKIGVIVEAPLDVEGDLMRARRRDTMIERAFNRMKKKREHDRERERIRTEITEKRRKEKRQRDWEDMDDDQRIAFGLIEEIIDTIENEEKGKMEKEKEKIDEKKEDEEKKDEEKKEEEKEKEKEEDPNKDEEKKDEEIEEQENEKPADDTVDDKKDDEQMGPIEDSEKKEDEEEKIDDSEMSTEEKEDEDIEEEEEKESSSEEEDYGDEIDPIKRKRIREENDEILRLAIQQVDAKLQKRKEKEHEERVTTYFSEPTSSSAIDSDVLNTIKALQTLHADGEEERDELEELLNEVDEPISEEVSEENDESEKAPKKVSVQVKKKSKPPTKRQKQEAEKLKKKTFWIKLKNERQDKEADEKKEEEKEGDEEKKVEMQSSVFKVTATKKTRLELPPEEWDSLSTSYHQADSLNLFGVQFAKCGEETLVPVVDTEEVQDAIAENLKDVSAKALEKMETAASLDKRYQDEDALPRAISRFRRCEAVDNAMRRDTVQISEEVDPEVAELEDLTIGFLSSSIQSTKRDALVEKQMADLDKKTLQIARSKSPIHHFNRQPSNMSILGNYSIDYNPREYWDKLGEEHAKDQHEQFVRHQFERIDGERVSKLDRIAEGAITQHDKRAELPCSSKDRQDAAKEKIVEKFNTKARSLMLDAYDHFYDDEGNELRANTLKESVAKPKENKKCGPRKIKDQLASLDENLKTFARRAKIIQFVDKKKVNIQAIPAKSSEEIVEDSLEWFEKLRKLEISDKKKVKEEVMEVSELTASTAEGEDEYEKEEMEQELEQSCDEFDPDAIREIYDFRDDDEVKKEDGEEKKTEVKVEENIDEIIKLIKDRIEEKGGKVLRKEVDLRSGDKKTSDRGRDQNLYLVSKRSNRRGKRKVKTGPLKKRRMRRVMRVKTIIKGKKKGMKKAITEGEVEDTEKEVKEEEPGEGEIAQDITVEPAQKKNKIKKQKKVVVKSSKKSQKKKKTKKRASTVKVDPKDESVKNAIDALLCFAESSPPKETKEEAKDDTMYEDHVVTMTKGGKTVTQIVRRPSNAAAMKNIPKIIKAKNSSPAKKPTGNKVTGKKSPTKNVIKQTEKKVEKKTEKKVPTVEKKKDEKTEERKSTVGKKGNTEFVILKDDDPMIFDDEEAMQEIREIEHENAKRKNINKRQLKWGVSEKTKLQMEDEIEDELDDIEFGPSIYTQKLIIKGKKARGEEIDLKELPHYAEELDELNEEERIAAMDEIYEQIEQEDEDDEDTDEPRMVTSDSEEEGADGSSKSKQKRKKRKGKAASTKETTKKFPWLADVAEYSSVVMTDQNKKLAKMREDARIKMMKKTEAIKPRVYRFKLDRKKKKDRKKNVTPFHYLYNNNLPEEVERDLLVLKMIINNTINDQTASSAELKMLRKKIDRSKRDFTKVIQKRGTNVPKSFNDLVRFAIHRGEGYAQRLADLKTLEKWKSGMKLARIPRSKRAAILKQVKVTRDKLNARFGQKFRRSDWCLKREMERRWRKELPGAATPPQLGNRQLLSELRHIEDEDLELDEVEMTPEQQIEMEREKKNRDESEKNRKKKNDDEAVIRSKGLLKGNLIVFERRVEEIAYSDVEKDSDEEMRSNSPSDSEADDDFARKRRERSWTFETIQNSDDDESFVDFGHAHWIGHQVFPAERTKSPTEDPETLAKPPPNLVCPPGAFSDIEEEDEDEEPSESSAATNSTTAATVIAVQHAAMTTPPKPENQPRPFLTLAQRKAYFTEETDEERKKKEEEEAKKREEEERLETIRKEEEKKKEEERERKAEERRLEELKIAEEERLEKEREIKEDQLFDDVMSQIDENTWGKQLKIIVDRTMLSFRRSEAVDYLLTSCDEMDCTKAQMLTEIDEWEKIAEKKRIATGPTGYMPLKSLFDNDVSGVVKRGTKAQKKKDVLAALPDSVLIEDLVDSMCTFIAAHVDDVTILSELRMTSEKNPMKIRAMPNPVARDELLVKKSIAAVSIEEENMVTRTLEDTSCNNLSVVGAISSGHLLSASRKNHQFLDDVNGLVRKNVAVAVESEKSAASGSSSPTVARKHVGDFKCVKKDLVERLRIKSVEDIKSLENSIIDDVLTRGESPHVENALEFALDDKAVKKVEFAAPIHPTIRKRSSVGKRKGIRPVPSISESFLEKVASGEQEDMDEMLTIENKKIRREFLRMRNVIDLVRENISENIGETINAEKLDQYLSEYVWTDSGCASKVTLVIEDIKKQEEKERRSRIEIGDLSAHVFDLSAVGQLERWMDDIFYLPPFSDDGKRIAIQMSTRLESSLHCQLVLRNEEDEDEDIVKRIVPEIVMEWIEDDEENSEVVHKFASLPAHQWDSIERLIRLAEEEKKEDGVISDDDDEEVSVLIPRVSENQKVVVVEKEDLTVDQEGIVNNEKFDELEYRHSTRVLKHQTVGFNTKKSINVWKTNYNRAKKSGRLIKTLLDKNQQDSKSAAPDIRESLRYKTVLNSIKESKGIAKERVELLAEPIRQAHLKEARKEVRKQKKLIRKQCKKKFLDEIKSYKDQITRVMELQQEEKKKRSLQIVARKTEEEKETKKVQKKVEEPVIPFEERPLFDDSLASIQVKKEIDDDLSFSHANEDGIDVKPVLPLPLFNSAPLPLFDSIKTEPVEEEHLPTETEPKTEPIEEHQSPFFKAELTDKREESRYLTALLLGKLEPVDGVEEKEIKEDDEMKEEEAEEVDEKKEEEESISNDLYGDPIDVKPDIDGLARALPGAKKNLTRSGSKTLQIGNEKKERSRSPKKKMIRKKKQSQLVKKKIVKKYDLIKKKKVIKNQVSKKNLKENHVSTPKKNFVTLKKNRSIALMKKLVARDLKKKIPTSDLKKNNEITELMKKEISVLKKNNQMSVQKKNRTVGLKKKNRVKKVIRSKKGEKKTKTRASRVFKDGKRKVTFESRKKKTNDEGERSKVEEQELETPNPLKRRQKTVEELLRPLNDREARLMKILQEKRAMGQTILSLDDLKRKEKKEKITVLPVRPEVELLNDGSAPVIRMLLRKVKLEEGQTEEDAEERYIDAFYNVEEQLKKQKRIASKVGEIVLEEMEEEEEEKYEEEEEEEGEIDLDVILFQSYPNRVRRVLVKSMRAQEERMRLHMEKFHLYQRLKERRAMKEWAEKDRKMQKELEELERREMEEEERRELEDLIPADMRHLFEKKEEPKMEEKKENGDQEKNEGEETAAEADKKERRMIPYYIYKHVKGKMMRIRNIPYIHYKNKMRTRRHRIIMGGISSGRNHPITRVHYLGTEPKSQALIRAEKEAEIALEKASSVIINVDTKRMPISKEILGQFVSSQVLSEDAKLAQREKFIAEHDKMIEKMGMEVFEDDVEVALKEDAEIDKMIEENKSHNHAMESYRHAIESMRANALENTTTFDEFDRLEQELDEAVENERRVLNDYLTMLKTMDTRRFQELAKLWTFDIESDDDEEILEEKRWSRVRQFVLQKPMGGPKNWESTIAYVDEWEEKSIRPRRKEIAEALGPLDPNFRGIKEKKRQGYFINDHGLPVKPKKPKHFRPLDSSPERIYNSDLEEMFHKDLNERHLDNLEKRKKISDRCNHDFFIRQTEVRERGLKRKRELMKKFKKTEASMPPMGVGLQRIPDQNSVFDPMPVGESYWSHLRRVNPDMDALLKKRLENTREMFAAVVQPMYRTILALRETRRRMEYAIAVKDLDSDDEERKNWDASSDAVEDSDQSDSDRDERDEPTYILRKRPRLCRTTPMEEDGEEGDDEDEDSDRPSSPERSDDSEREEESGSEEEEEESEDNEVIIEEQPKKLKKPTLFKREIKREIPDDFDLTKVKEEEPDEDQEEPPIADVTPKRRPQVRKHRGRPRKSIGSGRSDSESPFYEAPPTSLRRATGKRPLISDRSAVDFYDEDEQIRLAIEESLKDQPSTSGSGPF